MINPQIAAILAPAPGNIFMKKLAKDISGTNLCYESIIKTLILIQDNMG